MPVEEAQRRTALLGFADAMDVRADIDTTMAPGPELHLLTFSLDREEFGIPVTQVREVIRVADITRVPQAPAHVRGVANLRGRILAVVELRSRLGLAAAELTPRSRVIVVEVRERVLGLLVDAVSQVTKVPEASVAPAPEEVLSMDADYVTGVARWQSRLIILLDLEKALLPTE
ncbi:MAG TPA: chemotaxis protein CheW [Gemmatimonadales bacterium]|nr:chemotaxis protein CheW [Gemmatimonadales bacterium]